MPLTFYCNSPCQGHSWHPSVRSQGHLLVQVLSDFLLPWVPCYTAWVTFSCLYLHDLFPWVHIFSSVLINVSSPQNSVLPTSPSQSPISLLFISSLSQASSTTSALMTLTLALSPLLGLIDPHCLLPSCHFQLRITNAELSISHNHEWICLGVTLFFFFPR